jgi:hypothetical protein
MRVLATVRGMPCNPALEQEIPRHRQFEIKGRVLKYGAELRQGRHRIAQHVVSVISMRLEFRTNKPESSWNSVVFVGAVRTEHPNEFPCARLETDFVHRADRAMVRCQVLSRPSLAPQPY